MELMPQSLAHLLPHLVFSTKNRVLFPSHMTTLLNSCRPTACDIPAQGNALGIQRKES